MRYPTPLYHSSNLVNPWRSFGDSGRPRKTHLGGPLSTVVANGSQAIATHLRHTFFGLTQASRASQASFWCQRTRNEQGYHLGKWRGHTFWIFLSYSRSKLIKFSVDFSGIFQRSSNLNTYRNEASKDIFSCSSQSLWIWVIWRLFGGFNHQPAQFRWTGEGSTTSPLQRKRYSNIFSRISLIKTSSESPFSGLQVLVQAFFD